MRTTTELMRVSLEGKEEGLKKFVKEEVVEGIETRLREGGGKGGCAEAASWFCSGR
jgi:hypothetical protein